MKPTERIIELAKRLHDLGYRKEINKGDWYLMTYTKRLIENVMCIYSGTGKFPDADKYTTYTPIPSLEDGLGWLEKEHCQKQGNILSLVYIDTFNENDEPLNAWRVNLISENCNTPHEAVLLAMIKVLEEK